MTQSYIKADDNRLAVHSFEITRHPYSPRHRLMVVRLRDGRVFASPSPWEQSADFLHDEPEPTESTVRYCWKHNRNLFLPYSEKTKHAY